jgi:hypothetical protein
MGEGEVGEGEIGKGEMDEVEAGDGRESHVTRKIRRVRGVAARPRSVAVAPS